MHDVGVRDVAVGEHDRVDALAAADRFELGLVLDRDAVRIARAGQAGGIAAAGDARDLRRREGDDLAGGIVAIDDVEVVEVAAGRAQDDDASQVCVMHGVPCTGDARRERAISQDDPVHPVGKWRRSGAEVRPSRLTPAAAGGRQRRESTALGVEVVVAGPLLCVACRAPVPGTRDHPAVTDEWGSGSRPRRGHALPRGPAAAAFRAAAGAGDLRRVHPRLPRAALRRARA